MAPEALGSGWSRAGGGAFDACASGVAWTSVRVAGVSPRSDWTQASGLRRGLKPAPHWPSVVRRLLANVPDAKTMPFSRTVERVLDFPRRIAFNTCLKGENPRG